MAAAGCGGDDTQGTPATDASTDKGGHPDVTQPDGTVGDDGGGDVQVTDTGSGDADGGSTDGTVDALPLGQFGLAMAQAYCQRSKDCCAAYDGGTLPDGGQLPFVLSVCVGFLQSSGWENSVTGLDVNGAAAHVTYDPAKAAACVAAINNPGASKFSCPVITSTEYSGITDTCYSAVTGTVGPDASCAVDIECQPGNFCQTGDAGGACAALLATGTACSRDGQCSYRGKGAYCNADAGCQPPLALDTACITNVQCASGLCDENGFCNTHQIITASYNCEYDPLPDSGTD
jgi:hypothetical protein